MKTFATILGTAGTIAFGALTVATAASAAPLQNYPTTNTGTTLSAPFAEHGSGADRQSDRMRECSERARINGYMSLGMEVAGVDSCAVGTLPGLVGIGQ